MKKRLIFFLVFIIVSTIFCSSIINAENYIDTPEYTISPASIELESNEDKLINKKILIRNKGSKTLYIDIRKHPYISYYTAIDDSNISIASGDNATVRVSFYFDSQTSVKNGSIMLRKDIKENIPVNFKVGQNQGKISNIMAELNLLSENAVTGREYRYIVNLFNFYSERPMNLTLDHTIKNIENNSNTTIVLNDSVYLIDSMSILKEISIPEDMPVGDYELAINISYTNSTSTLRGIFSVERPFLKKKVGGVVPVWIILSVLATLIVGYIIYAFIKYEQNKHKRFHVNVDYKALPKPGDRSLFVGNIAETTKKTYMDMDKLTVHTIVAGSTGGGKSISAQDIVEECLEKDVGVVVFDPTAQWSGMLRKLSDKKFLSFYPKFGMNPKKDARAYPGNIKAIKDYRQKINIFKYMKPGEIQVFTTNKLDPKNYDIFVANMIRQIFRSNLEEFRGLRYLIIFDEIHRILPKFGGSGAGFTQIERGCREFRKWGIGILLISQVLSDFVGEIKANINTQVQMKTRDESDLNRIKMQYGEEFIQELVKAPVGSGMVQNSSWNNGKPYYVTFRPIKHSVVRLKDDELDLFNQYNEIVEDLQFQLEQLEQEGQDVFDLKLELKLAVDKIKSGNFNMVKIYLDGLTPRIQKFWDKIGKEPKHLEVELVSEEEIKEDLEKAKKENKAAKQAEPEPQKKEEKEEEVKMSEEQVKENLEALEKLFEEIQKSMDEKDYISINDRMIEIQSTPLPKEEKAKIAKRIEEINKKIEEAKKAENAQ